MSDINTSERLFDLVRFMRSELHEANLISDREYAWLACDSDMANSSKGGSPSVARLEEYDDLRAELAALRKEIENQRALLADSVNRRIEEQAEFAEWRACAEKLADSYQNGFEADMAEALAAYDRLKGAK